MCGIVGVIPLNKENLEVAPLLRKRLSIWLHNEVLFHTVERGKDATGLAFCFGPHPSYDETKTKEEIEKLEENFFMCLKQPVKTGDFFENDGSNNRYRGQEEGHNTHNVMRMANNLTRPLLHIIGHTRQKTIGSEFNPNNNHPITVGNIIGIHNGGVKNYEEIYKKHSDVMTPQGEVDSEAIMQLLALNGNERELELDDIKFVTERIEGPATVIAFNRKYPRKILYFRGKERPLDICYIPELGLAVLTSNRDYLKAALSTYTRAKLSIQRELPDLSHDYMYIQTERGGIIDIDAPVKEDSKIEALFPLSKTADVLDEYKKDNGNTTTGNNSNTGVAGGKSHETRKRVGSGTTSVGRNTKDPPEAEVFDMSTYSAGDDDESSTEVVVASAEILGDDEDLDNDQDDDDIEDASFQDLQKDGHKWALSSEVPENQHLLINKSEGDFKSLLNVNGISETESAEIVHTLYPEVFGDGYAVGYKAGFELGETSFNDDKELERVEKENGTLRELLVKEKDSLLRGGAIMANLKAFLIAMLINYEAVAVDNSSTDYKSLGFDEDIEQFLETTQGFEKVDVDIVKKMFTSKDIGNIERLLHKVALEGEQKTNEGGKTYTESGSN